MIHPRPAETELSSFFQNYVDLVADGDILQTLQRQCAELHEFFLSVTTEDSNRLHPPYTWTIKQVVGHMIDTEKIFGYRAHRIASNDPTPLAGFDQNEMVRSSHYESVDLPSLVDELLTVRKSNWMLLKRLPPDRWDQRGICDEQEITVRAIAFVLAGHVEHHLRIVRQRIS